MINRKHLQSLLYDTLRPIPKFCSPEALVLLEYTSVIESDRGTFLTQLGGGPALGLMGVEPRTMVDNYENYLDYRPELLNTIGTVCGVFSQYIDPLVLRYNLAFNILMARVWYYRAKPPIPVTMKEVAKYHEKHYNTKTGNYASTGKEDWQVGLEKWERFQ